MKPVQFARAPWSDAVFVCRKCARKAGAKRFRKELAHALKEQSDDRRFRVIEAGCLDICPKRRIAVAIGNPVGRRPLLVASPAAPGETAAALLAKG